MKNKLKAFILPLSLGLVMSVTTVLSLATISSSCDVQHCTDKDYPLYCSSADKCCPADHPYTDGHGTCYGTLEGCRASGYPCETCWDE